MASFRTEAVSTHDGGIKGVVAAYLDSCWCCHAVNTGTKVFLYFSCGLSFDECWRTQADRVYIETGDWFEDIPRIFGEV
jgi:hypothetical protein